MRPDRVVVASPTLDDDLVENLAVEQLIAKADVEASRCGRSPKGCPARCRRSWHRLKTATRLLLQTEEELRAEFRRLREMDQKVMGRTEKAKPCKNIPIDVFIYPLRVQRCDPFQRTL